MADVANSFRAVRRLLAEVIDSFEKLEVLLHLYRVKTGAQTNALAKALLLTDEAVAEALSELRRDGIVRTSKQDGLEWSFDPNGPRAATVEALAKLYADDRMEVLKLMTEVALERVRARTAQRFADAFLVRLKKPKGDPDA